MQVWDQLIGAVCRPHRIEYKTNDLLGGINGSRTVGHTVVRRQDFVITNARDQRLQCSFWQRDCDDASSSTPLPAVIYCHCNSGSRLDAIEAIWTLVPMGVRVFALDFSGSGISEGEYVTLGANEVEDLTCLVQFIRDGGHTSTIALWGRSMGAVTALLYSERDPSVAGIVLDSPFSRLVDLMKELVEDQNIPLWGLVGGTALKLMRRSVKKRAGFDISTISPLDTVSRAFTPAFFGHAAADSFVKAHHSERLHAAYAGDKELMLFREECDHNSPRPDAFYEAVRSFMARALQLRAGAASRNSIANVADARASVPDALLGATHSTSPFEVPSLADMHSPSEGSPSGDEDGDVNLQAALQLSMQDLALSTGGADGTGTAQPPSPPHEAPSPDATSAARSAASADAARGCDNDACSLRDRHKAREGRESGPWQQPARAAAHNNARGTARNGTADSQQLSDDEALQAAIAASLQSAGMQPESGHSGELCNSGSSVREAEKLDTQQK